MTTSSGNVFSSLKDGKPSTGTDFLNGATYTDGLGVMYTNYLVYYTNTYVTNGFGTNLSVAVTGAGGAYASTNFYYTNLVVGLIYATNSLYTNGTLEPWTVLVTGTNWSVGGAADTTTVASSGLNASNRVYSPIFSSAATNPPPFQLGSSTQSSTSQDANGNTIIGTTNTFNQQVVGMQIVSATAGITTNTGTLTFENLQMSQDFIVGVAPARGPDFPIIVGVPSIAQITLSNPQLDPAENPQQIIAPTLDPLKSSALLSALSTTYVDQSFPDGVFNFERSTFRVLKNQNGTNGGMATISVNRVGGDPTASVSVQYLIDPGPGDMAPNYGGVNAPCTYSSGYNPANTFPLQAGSDYATPNIDFTPTNGTLSWAANDFNPKQITIPILNNGAVEFNEDFQVHLFNPQPQPQSPPAGLGEVNVATVTILFDNSLVLGGQFPGQQPAGAVDRSWNKDGFADSTPPFLQYPGTTPGVGGTVYAVAAQPNGMAVIAGSFISFDSTPYSRIVRTLPNGYQDPTFLVAPNSGANDYIDALALQPNGQILIGGNFTAFNGYDRHYIARLNYDGSVDPSFDPGLGANGTVTSVALNSASGQIIIAGSFTSYNGTAVNQVARLNPDGSLDTEFYRGHFERHQCGGECGGAGCGGRVLIGGNFTAVGGVDSGAVARLNVDGSLDATFTPGIGTYNPETTATDPVQAIAVQPDGRIFIGGSFAYYNLVNQNGLVRLNTDGTLDLSFDCGTGTLNPITGVADTINTLLLQPDGNLLIGGNFTTYNQTRRIGYARVFPDGTLDTSFMDSSYNEFAGLPNEFFNPNAVNPDSAYLAYNTRNAVYALALENNPITTASNLLIGGTFTRVGGGNTRDDIHPRSNVARVIGGITPGPGNIEFVYNNYSVNNSDGTLYVSLERTNGNLGPIGASFETNTAAPGPGIASGADFSLSPIYAQPTWDTAWYNNAWTRDTGSYGPNYALNPGVGLGATIGNPIVYIHVFNPGNISGNLSANFVLTNPVGNLVLGGQYIPVGAALGAQSGAPLTIIDSNVKAGVLGFSSSVYSAIQGTTATITLTRTNGSQNQVTVWYATGDGTATNGVDYTGATNQVTFAIGQTNVTFPVPTLSRHTSIQADKIVNLRLFTPGGGATLGVTNATLTIINASLTYGFATFSQTNYSINENGKNAVITVDRLGGSSGTLGVTFEMANGTATNGINYLGLTTNLFWNNGDATSRTISIPVMDDGVVTPNLWANLILTNALVNGTNNQLPLAYGGTNAILTVVNVDSAGTFEFSLGAYGVKKFAGYAQIPVIRIGGSIGTAQVSFTTADDTAVQGTDYIAVTNTLTFTNGQTSMYVNVPVLDSGLTNNPSGPRDLILQLSNPTGLATLGALNPAKLYIIDSDAVLETPGSPDNTYSALAGFNNNVYAVTLQPNNQLLVGGDFTMADGVARNHIARLNNDGSLDADFSLPSDAAAPTVRCGRLPFRRTGGSWWAASSPISTAWRGTMSRGSIRTARWTICSTPVRARTMRFMRWPRPRRQGSARSCSGALLPRSTAPSSMALAS